MTTAVALDDTGRVWLHTTEDVVTRVGLGLTPQDLHRWIHTDAITPTQPPTGSGSQTGWSSHDLLVVEAIARVRADLHTLRLHCPRRLVAELWDQLEVADTATIDAGTVTITVTIEPGTR